MWCGLSANLECRSEICCTRLARNAEPKNSPKNCHLGTIAQLCRATSSQLRHVSTIGKKFQQQYLLHMSSQYGELRPTRGWNRSGSLKHLSYNFNWFRVLAALLHDTPVLGVSQTLRRWTEGATYRAAITLSIGPHSSVCLRGHNDCLLPTEIQLKCHLCRLWSLHIYWWSRQRGNKSNGAYIAAPCRLLGYYKLTILCGSSLIMRVRCPVCLHLSVLWLSVTLVYCGQTVGWIKMKLGMEVGLGPSHIVLDGDPAPPPRKGHRGTAPQFSAYVCCGQTAGWMKMPLGTNLS